ncbi:hypothetical protein [Cystobacter fuscus]|uniref:hypothetical protein n=1 Tax=Cystobacter fuscus TaxID=43 RepID=UPI0037C17953
MKAGHGDVLLLGLCCALTAGPVQAFDEAAAARTLEVARRKLARTAEEVPVGQYPAGAPVTDDLGQLTLKSTTAGEFQLTGHTLGLAPGRARRRRRREVPRHPGSPAEEGTEADCPLPRAP